MRASFLSVDGDDAGRGVMRNNSRSVKKNTTGLDREMVLRDIFEGIGLMKGSTAYFVCSVSVGNCYIVPAEMMGEYILLKGIVTLIALTKISAIVTVSCVFLILTP